MNKAYDASLLRSGYLPQILEAKPKAEAKVKAKGYAKTKSLQENGQGREARHLPI